MNCIDIDRLNRKIEESSTTREAIAHEIGIDITTFNRRVKSGKLLIGDLHKMCMILQLSSSEAKEIFLCEGFCVRSLLRES